MIYPEQLKEFTSYSKQDLVDLLAKTGYTDTNIRYSKFKGINNQGDFVYEIVYYDQDFQIEETSFVFVKFNHNLLVTTAEF
jgi:hypothetical protein